MVGCAANAETVEVGGFAFMGRDEADASHAAGEASVNTDDRMINAKYVEELVFASIIEGEAIARIVRVFTLEGLCKAYNRA